MRLRLNLYKRVVARGSPWTLEVHLGTNFQRPVSKIENLPSLNFDVATVGPVSNKTEEMLFELRKLFRDYFTETIAELGCSKSCEIEIRLTDDKPFSYRPYRLSLSEQKKVGKIIDELLVNDIITEFNFGLLFSNPFGKGGR